MGFPSESHDHAACVDDALTRARAVCGRSGARLTDLRRRVLELVWESHRPIGAYAVLEALSKEQRAAPPTVYRALDFLREQGLVHRIESLNAYVGCTRPDTPHPGQFFLCRACGQIAEVCDPRVDAALAQTALDAGFAIEQRTVEMVGVCARCRRG
jgi:Fur family zinc uptake transcriptional regulator